MTTKVLSTRFTLAEVEAITDAMERSHVGNLHAYMRIAVLSLAGVSELPEQLRRRDDPAGDPDRYRRFLRNLMLEHGITVYYDLDHGEKLEYNDINEGLDPPCQSKK